MARKRTRITYQPRSRRNSSKSLNDRQTAAVDDSHEGEQNVSVYGVTNTEPDTSAKSPISKADEHSAKKIEGVLSPASRRPKSKRSKRRSTSIECRPRSRTNRPSSNAQSQSSSETSISVRRQGKINRHGDSEETADKTSVISEKRKGRKRTKKDSEGEEMENFSDSKSGQGRGRKSSRNSAAENDTEKTEEQSAVIVSMETSTAEVKRKKRKSTRIAYRPRSSSRSKESKQKKKKLSDDRYQANSSKHQKQTRQISKKDDHPGDTSESLSAGSDVDTTSRKTAKVSNKPQKKKRKHPALQVEDVSAADQNTEQTSEPRKKKPQRRKAESKTQKEEIPDRIRDMTVTKKAYARWKPLHSSTKDHVKQIIDSTIPRVLSVISSKASTRKDVQKHLETLKQRIFTRLQSIKGPTHQGDYSLIESQLKVLEDSFLSNNSQVEVLENELEVQKRLLEDEKEQLKTLTAGGDQNMGNVDMIDRSKLHRLLRSEPVNTLKLPPLPKESFERPIPKVPIELQEMSEQLSQAVTDITERAEAVEVPQWLEYLSQISDTLPGVRC